MIAPEIDPYFPNRYQKISDRPLVPPRGSRPRKKITERREKSGSRGSPGLDSLVTVEQNIVTGDE
ncbi:hypothetical protein HDF12_003825 [Edaphobacter lichenicola]|uniref:Uncharacterized protein n=1 Tax=Tunturiibacter lichenicola TaxID=2051959 RepID=A0A7Y9T4G1_9BACT|nr:hypothetical protein [Edaphobacter lichenicola]